MWRWTGNAKLSVFSECQSVEVHSATGVVSMETVVAMLTGVTKDMPAVVMWDPDMCTVVTSITERPHRNKSSP